jgi:hypothetical protein
MHSGSSEAGASQVGAMSLGQGGVPAGGPPGQLRKKKTVNEVVADAKYKEAQCYDVYELESTDPEAVEAVRNATNLVLLTKLTYTDSKGTEKTVEADSILIWP